MSDPPTSRPPRRAPGDPVRAILVDLIPKGANTAHAERAREEMVRLVQTAGGIIVVKVIQRRGRPSAKTYVGTGKAEEVAVAAKAAHADVVIVNGMLRATQSMHLQKYLHVPVLDRIDVILRIFELHARTAESQTQIELARLRYELPKLYGRGVEFSRIGGGMRTRGSGEQFLEQRKRIIKRRISELEKKLATVRAVQQGQRVRRRRRHAFTVSLVGYTNAGKSSLLRALTRKETLVADKPFSTLDTRFARLWLPDMPWDVLLADTIGFIQDLPPTLLASFRSTLEEVAHADLLMEVVDATDPEAMHKREVVGEILKELGAAEMPRVVVVNKIDRAPGIDRAKWRRFLRPHESAFVSTVSGTGLDQLKRKIVQHLERTDRLKKVQALTGRAHEGTA